MMLTDEEIERIISSTLLDLMKVKDKPHNNGHYIARAIEAEVIERCEKACEKAKLTSIRRSEHLLGINRGIDICLEIIRGMK